MKKIISMFVVVFMLIISSNLVFASDLFIDENDVRYATGGDYLRWSETKKEDLIRIASIVALKDNCRNIPKTEEVKYVLEHVIHETGKYDVRILIFMSFALDALGIDCPVGSDFNWVEQYK